MMFRLTDVVKHLLILNVLMFLVSNLIDTNLLALSYFQAEDFQPFQIATYFFMHGDISHLFFNMIGLVFFGTALEQLWGPKKFLFYYIFCAIGAAFLHYFIYYIDFAQIQGAIDHFRDNPTYGNFVSFFHNHFEVGSLTAHGTKTFEYIGEQLKAGNQEAVQQGLSLMNEVLQMSINAPKIIGASGAIFGILLGFGVFYSEREIYLLFLPIGIKAKYFIPVIMIMELQLGLAHYQGDNIAHFAHLGGALFGIILIFYWQKFGSRFD